MGDLHLKEVLFFLDDLIVFSDTLEEHEQRLLRLLHCLEEYGLKLSPEKCTFFQKSVKYLGHIVSEKGVETDPDKILALKSWPIPRTLKELKSFLGFAGYYQRFIKGYSAIAKPLNDLTRGYTPTSKAQKRSSPVKTQDRKQPFGERWSPACQLAFEMLIEKLTSSPVLGFADPKLQHILHTDASTTGLGAANAVKSDERNKARFDQRVTPSSLEEGGRVLVRNVRLRGKHKLEDKWERDVYVVVKRRDLPVYTVRPENRAGGPTRTLHRDLLLPCSFLPACGNPDHAPVAPPRRPQTRSQKPASVDPTEDLVEDEDGWNVSQVQIQPATFEFHSSPVDPSSGFSSQPLPREEPGGNLPETEGIPLTCVPENLPVEEPVLPDQAETSPSQNEQLLSPPPISVEAPNLPDPVVESIPVVRCSSRQRQPPSRLQYAALGNPLISVVQTLFYGFVNAYSEALSTAAATDLVQSRVYNV